MAGGSRLKLNAKFNLILSSLLIGLFVLTTYLTYQDQQELVRKTALEEAHGVSRQLIATFDHMSKIVRNEPENNYALVPQVVATQIAKRISRESSYTVRQVSLRFRNPDNRPDDYEAVQLKAFANQAEKEVARVAEIDGTKVFRYMKALVAEPSCLKCHGPYESAPIFIQQRFPQDHPSYNYQVGEVIGAVSFVKPMAGLYREVATSLTHELFYRVGIVLIVLLTTWFLVRRVMINPIRLASTTIHRVTTTGNLTERIPMKGSADEVGQLINDFNAMMEELDRTTLQRQESEDRYRSLIEAAQSAIVTFLENGKIVISNHQAEKLFNLSREKLLGETVFHFLENGDALQQKIAEFAAADKWGRKEATARYQLREATGRSQEVEVTLVLASETDHKPMFTAILRTIKADSTQP
jgi:PAS domain S-box-containing protein